jgi:hypothetical protein
VWKRNSQSGQGTQYYPSLQALTDVLVQNMCENIRLRDTLFGAEIRDEFAPKTSYKSPYLEGVEYRFLNFLWENIVSNCVSIIQMFFTSLQVYYCKAILISFQF